MKKTTLLALILICLIVLGVVCFRPVKAQYQGDITINADGSVTPSTAPIQRTGNLYVLTSNVDGSISVEGNNLILDGNGHALSSTSGDEQFWLQVNKASDVTVENFFITGNQMGPEYGILLTDSSNVVVANNTITNMGSILGLNAIEYAGIYVDDSNSNSITGNYLSSNTDGIFFENSSHNLIVANSITDISNSWGGYGNGISLVDSSNNTIYHNNFRNNLNGGLAQQAWDDSNSINVWDDGYPGGGNYWNDYQTKYPNAAQIDSSGVANTSYVIDSQNKDRNPLIQPFTSAFYANYLLEITPPKISVLSPLNPIFNKSSVSFTFSVDKAVNWAGYSLDGKQNVTIIGNSTLTEGAVTNVTIANITSGLHSITLYANDTFGNIGSSETVNFTISLPHSGSFPIVFVVAVSGAVAAVVVGTGLLVYFKKRKIQEKKA